MADATKYFKAVKGITDGMVHHAEDEVFAATESLLAHFDRTGGKDGDTVLYEEISASDYQKANVQPVGDALVNEDGSVVLGAGAPSGTDVVGGGVYDDPTKDGDNLTDKPQTTTLPDGSAVDVPKDSSVDAVLKADAKGADAPAPVESSPSKAAVAAKVEN